MVRRRAGVWVDVSDETVRRLRWFDDCGAVIAIGLHPTQAHPPGALERLSQLLETYPHWGVGEIGIDRRFDDLPSMAREQLAVAHHLDRFVLAHAVGKGALDRFAALVDSIGPFRGAIHAFSGSVEQADQWIRRGWMLSIGGPITYPNRPKLQRWVAEIPDNHLLVETDCPDLPAVGAEIGTPLHLRQIVQTVATVRGVSADDVASTSLINARRWLGPQFSTLRRS